MFLEYAKTYQDNIVVNTLYPNADDRSAWEGLPLDLRNRMLVSGEKYLGYTYPQITAADYMRFSKDGNRCEFEKKYFDRREALNALVLAECIEYKGRFLEDIINGIFLLCEESGWNLPPHNGYQRNVKTLPIADRTRPIIELFACETGAQLAMIRYLLHSRLNSIDGSICERIDSELYERIFVPFFTVHFWWMGNGDEPMCNWTSWCIQNILITSIYAGIFTSSEENSFFFAADRDHELYPHAHDRMDWLLQILLHLKPDLYRMTSETLSYDEFLVHISHNFDKTTALKLLRKLLLLQCTYSLDCFLKDYGEDGCCEEGALYYGHSGLCLFQSLYLMNAVSNHHFDDLTRQPKIRNMAAYIMNVHVTGNYYINYADCSPVLSNAGAREYLFGKMTADPDLMAYAVNSYFVPNDKLAIVSNDINLFYDVQQLFTHQEMAHYYSQFHASKQKDCYYESNGLFIIHDQQMTLAVKAGGNGDSHNHNDTGSLTLYKNGKPYLIDLGVETYTGKTFSSQRYDIWTMQSAWHNLPTINGYMQQDGSNYQSCNVITKLTGDSPYIQMELQNCYPKEAGISYYVRKVTMHRNQEIVLHDSWDDSVKTGFLSLITYDCPIYRDHQLFIGTLGEISLSEHGNITIEKVPITDERLAVAWKHEVYRIVIPFCRNELRLIIH